MHNIVQAEFFHVGSMDFSLELLGAECEDRMTDGSPLNTTVRFFDEGGFVTEFVQLYQADAQLPWKLLSQYKKASRWRRLMLAHLFYATITKRMTPEERLLRAQEFFFTIAETSRVIAVERPDHSFRPIEDNEFYDVKTAISRAAGASLFVFEPNELCADSNKIIATAL
jgi:hypothetical protein